MKRQINGVGGTGVLLLIAAAAVLPGVAEADGPQRFELTHPLYLEECGSCHVAYPPQLLPMPSWRALMGGLASHFGVNASLDPASVAAITDYLWAHAGRSERSAAAAPLRISETRWFRHEHREGQEGIPRGAFASEAIGSAANCGACHRGAAEGDYREERIRIPSLARRAD